MKRSFLADNRVPSRYPSWVLLDKRVYFDHREYATTKIVKKTVKTSTDEAVEIGFCPADPPGVSYFCVHSPKIREEDYTFEPRVVSSAENLVLLCFAFRTGPRNTDLDPDLVEFFVCKAGSGGNLSIQPVPYSPKGTRHSSHAGIVPREGGNFLVADLFPREDLGHYDLHVFSSETSKWTTTCLQLPDTLPRDLPGLPDKVISIEGSVVGWVDLWRGIIFCDVLEKEPTLRFIPLPTTAFNLHRTGQAQRVRDVSCCNGFISFVEIEHCFRVVDRRSFKTTQNLDTENVILDEACLVHDDLDNKPEHVPDGWIIRTMCKGISWDYWKKRHTVHVNDFVPEHSMLLRHLKTTGFPLFGVYGDNVVYLLSGLKSDYEEYWVVGVDLQKKMFVDNSPYCPKSASSFDPAVLPCAFSEYMNATPRSYAKLVAASFSQNGVLNNHLPLGGTIRIAISAQNSVLNNHLPFGDTVPVASSAQNDVPNGHLPLSDTVADNVQPQQNTSHSGCDNYQQPTPLQPQSVLPPNLPPTVQAMSSLTRSGYIFARWSDPDVHGKMLMTVPLNDMMRLAAAPLPVYPPFANS